MKHLWTDGVKLGAECESSAFPRLFRRDELFEQSFELLRGSVSANRSSGLFEPFELFLLFRLRLWRCFILSRASFGLMSHPMPDLDNS
jgi:hypothetical protein